MAAPDAARSLHGPIRHIAWMHDLSPRAAACLGPVEALLEPGGRISLVHATGDFPADTGPVADEARAALLPLRDALRDGGYVVQVCVVTGAPAEAVAAIDRAEAVDLVVAGATGVSGLDRVLVGSQATRLVRRATPPVLVVGQSFERLGRVVCPVSPDEPDLAAVRHAAALSVQHQAQLDLVAVEPAGSGTEDLPGAIEAVRTALATADDLVAALPGHTVRAVLGETVLHGILIASRGADLIVIGSHGRTGVQRWLFGSTAEDLVHEGHRSVLVVRPSP